MKTPNLTTIVLFHSIADAEATVPEDLSEQMFQELFAQRSWRCYTSVRDAPFTEVLADTFLRLHAKGYVLDEVAVPVQEPPIVIAWRDQTFRWIITKGVIYANGAVIIQDNTDAGTRKTLVFVENETAQVHSYPDGYMYAYETIVKEVKREIKDASVDAEH